MSDQVKTGYGSFVLAATAYIVGVLLFSFWSFNAHRRTLNDYANQALFDAAFATQEILGADISRIIAQGSNPLDDDHRESTQRLMRLAQHGDFSLVGAAYVSRHDTRLLVSGTNTDGQTEPEALQTDLRRRVERMSAEPDGGSMLFISNGPDADGARNAIIFEHIRPGSGIAYIAARRESTIKNQLGDQMFRTTAAAIGMVVLAIPLIALFSRTQRTVTHNLSQLNSRLQHDMDNQKNREAELKDAISDLERFNAVSSGRENRIIELKAEVNDLLEQMNRNKRYNIDKID